MKVVNHVSPNSPRFNNRWRDSFAAVAVAFAVLVASPKASAVVVDGIFDPTEGYANVTQLFFQLDNGTMVPNPGTLAWNVDGSGNVTVAFVQPLSINDNTYGTNSIGWGKKGHTFGNLTGSDKAQFNFTNGAGQSLIYTMDYISQSSTASSGYASLGVAGGDGSVGGGKKGGGKVSDVTAWGTSLDYNLNHLGFKTFTTNSPATTPHLNPDGTIDYSQPYNNPASAPGWVYYIEYEMQVSAAAFGASGFGGVTVPFAHDSPSKLGQNTIIVVPEASSYVAGIIAVMFALLFHLRQRRVKNTARA